MLPGEEGEVPCSLCCTVVGTEMGVPGNNPSQGRGLSISWEFQTMIFPVVLWPGLIAPIAAKVHTAHHEFHPAFQAHQESGKGAAKSLRITSRCYLTQALRHSGTAAAVSPSQIAIRPTANTVDPAIPGPAPSLPQRKGRRIGRDVRRVPVGPSGGGERLPSSPFSPRIHHASKKVARFDIGRH